MRKKLLGFAGALLALSAALCLAPGSATCAIAQTYDLADGSVTVKASGNKQYVNDVEQTSDIVICQTGSDTTSIASTITVEAGFGQTAEVTLSGVNIDVSGEDKAAMAVSGSGDVTVTLLGRNVLKSGESGGFGYAGLTKANTGNLTITAKDTNQSLTATGGRRGAGIGGSGVLPNDVSDITISGGSITAEGGGGAAGIGSGFSAGEPSSASGITITGGVVEAKGGYGGGAGIGGGSGGSGTNIVISGGRVTARGGRCGAGIGGGYNGGCSDITVSGAAQLRAQGGSRSEFNEGSGAPIGNGGSRIGSSTPVDGVGVRPETGCLDTDGWIEYYDTGVDMATANPRITVNGTGGHDWGEATYSWSDDHSSCTATRVCSKNANHTETEIVDAVATVTQEQSCTGDELTAYTAEFENEAFTTQTVKNVVTAKATGHDFTAEKPDAAYLKSAATCTERAVYYKSCSVCGESSKGAEGEDTFWYGKPLDHDWGEATYSWSDDRSTCTATRTCKNDADRVESETVDAVATVTQKQSCTADELTTYTATFKNAAFATQTVKDVKTAEATGHDFTAETAEAAYLKSAATCTEKAVYYKSCSACGESSKGADDEATFEAGDPLGHKGGTATCVHKAVCETCGKEYGELDPTNHEALTHVAAKAATTKAEGNIEYWHCSDCDRYFSDAAGTKEIKQSDTVIAKKSEPKKDEPKKEEAKVLPKTGDDATVQLGLLLSGGFTALGAALVVKKRTA